MPSTSTFETHLCIGIQCTLASRLSLFSGEGTSQGRDSRNEEPQKDHEGTCAVTACISYSKRLSASSCCP